MEKEAHDTPEIIILPYNSKRNKNTEIDPHTKILLIKPISESNKNPIFTLKKQNPKLKFIQFHLFPQAPE